MRLPALCLLTLLCAIAVVAQQPPKEWIDSDTGHRVVRLTDEPGSQSLYFHQNPYTASGDKMVFTSPTGLYAYNFKTGESELLVEGLVGSLIVGPKTRWTINIDEGKPRLMHKRTMDMEIAGHEFFGPHDMLWYDLQTPKSQVFWLAGVNVKTGIEPNVTFTPDQKWIVFRSNMLGRTYVFAVEVKPQISRS